MKKALAIFAICTSLTTTALADSASQESSALMAIGSSNIVKGSVQMLSAGAQLSIASAERSGEFMVVVIKDSSSASEVVLKLSARALGNVSLAAGQSIEVVVGSAGKLLVVAGQVIAVIPNELGKGLVKSSKLD
jgi:hypothetical protein